MRAVLQKRCHDAVVFAVDCGACHLPALPINQMPSDLHDGMNVYITHNVLSLIAGSANFPPFLPRWSVTSKHHVVLSQ